MPKLCNCFRLKVLPLRLTAWSSVFSQMPPLQGTLSLGWLTAPSRPATASGQSQSRCLCFPRSSPPSMKVRVCYCLLSIFFSLTHIFVSCSSSPTKSLLHWWHREMFRLALLPFPCWCFEMSPMTTDASSQLMKGWMMSQGTLNYRVVERFFLLYLLFIISNAA